MAGEEVRVSIEALNQAINDYKAKKQAMQIAYLQISNTMRELSTTWKGTSSQKFAEQFDQLYKNLQQTETQMDNATSKLEQARDAYEEVDAQAKSLMQSVEEGTTPTFF
ncbi:MAG: WXG100 family type VII secretion target [Clostridia bacterium]|nr:WXG100 family type VII secretion target [Clostridia bacterium]